MSVVHDEAGKRFVYRDENGEGEITYSERGDGVVSFDHTGVDPKIQGGGVASELAEFAVNHARAQGWKVIPACSFVRSWLERHPDQADVVQR